MLRINEFDNEMYLDLYNSSFFTKYHNYDSSYPTEFNNTTKKN